MSEITGLTAQGGRQLLGLEAAEEEQVLSALHADLPRGAPPPSPARLDGLVAGHGLRLGEERGSEHGKADAR